MTFQIHALRDENGSALIRLWHQGWHDAHANLVPVDVLDYRKPEYFAIWLNECADEFFTASSDRGLLGFVSIKNSEIVKLYVHRKARGTGVAKALLAHAEKTLLARGVEAAELFCTAGNNRAEHFYAKEGWHLARTFRDYLWMPNGRVAKYSVETNQYEKSLTKLLEHC